MNDQSCGCITGCSDIGKEGEDLVNMRIGSCPGRYNPLVRIAHSPAVMLFLVSAVCLKIDPSCTFHNCNKVGAHQKALSSDTVPVYNAAAAESQTSNAT
jgi:hypothetical protein